MAALVHPEQSRVGDMQRCSSSAIAFVVLRSLCEATVTGSFRVNFLAFVPFLNLGVLVEDPSDSCSRRLLVPLERQRRFCLFHRI